MKWRGDCRCDSSRNMLPTGANEWSPSAEALRCSNDNAQASSEPGPCSTPAQSGVNRIAIAGPIEEGLVASLDDYHRDYGLNAQRLRRAAPDAIVMHPGPMNRGIEITDDVADGPQSRVLRQVANGVAVRMAVLEALLG